MPPHPPLVALALALVLLAPALPGPWPGLPAGWVETVAGRKHRGFLDAPGSEARFNEPLGIAVDAQENVYVADSYNHRIRMLTPAGAVLTVAGGGQPWRGGGGWRDGDRASARFRYPRGLAVDLHGALYVADTNNNAIRLVTPDGRVSTLAGGAKGLVDGPGPQARFCNPYGLAVDGRGVVYVADTYNHRIRRVLPDGTVSTLAGCGPSGVQGGGYADGPGARARFRGPRSVAVGPDGAIYVADAGNRCIRRITPEGEVSTLTARGQIDVGGWLEAVCDFAYPTGLAFTRSGTLLVADAGDHRLYEVSPAGGVSPRWGSVEGLLDGFWGSAKFRVPSALAVAPSGNVYVADTGNQRVRRLWSAGL